MHGKIGFSVAAQDAAGSMQKRDLRSSQISSMKNVHGCTFFIRDGSHRLCELSVPPRTAVVPNSSKFFDRKTYR